MWVVVRPDLDLHRRPAAGDRRAGRRLHHRRRPAPELPPPLRPRRRRPARLGPALAPDPPGDRRLHGHRSGHRAHPPLWEPGQRRRLSPAPDIRPQRPHPHLQLRRRGRPHRHPPLRRLPPPPDDAGRPVTALHLAGAAADGTDAEIKRFGYDEDGNLAEDYNSSGLPLRFAYDERLRVTSWTDRNNRSYAYTYDQQDRCIAEGGEAGHLALTLTYGTTDPAWPGCTLTTLATTDGATTRFVINDNSQVIAEIDPLGAVTRTEYDRHHNLTATTDALGHTTRYTYDGEHRCTTVTRPDGSETHAVYDRHPTPVELISADGTVWRQSLDEHGNRIALTDPAGHTTRYAYDDSGRLVSVTDPLGAVTEVQCNAAGLATRITGPTGGAAAYEWDGFGRLIAATDPAGATTRVEWTVEGQPARRTGPDGAQQRWTYDGEGNCLTFTNAAGHTTAFTYTHFDRVATRTDPGGTTHAFTHDHQLRLTQVTNPQGLTWDYTYDRAGRLIAESDFDNRHTAYELDPAGHLIARTTPLGTTLTYRRDTLGRLTEKTADDTVTRYTYDSAGRLASASGPDGELSLQRDVLGQITAEEWNGETVTFAYDPAGRRTHRTTPSGHTSTYAYDTAGRRTRVTTGSHTLDFTHDAAGRETERSVGALTLASRWNPAGRLTRQTVTAGPTSIQSRAYTYRPDGYLLVLDDQLSGPQTFDLDSVGRVTRVTAADWTETYAYDSLGAQTTATWPAEHAAPDATGQRTHTGTTLTRAGHYRYQHDDAGRLVRRTRTRISKKPETWRFAYDTEDRLIHTATPDGTEWRYTYDPLGRRRSKTRLTPGTDTPAETITFAYDGPTLVEQTTHTPGRPNPVTLTWDHDGIAPISQTERITDATTQDEIDARFFAIVTDLVGTPRELVTPDGDIAWRTRTTLYGTIAWNRDATAHTPLRFPGQYADPETGLHYNLHRYYDPITAHYTTPDPLGLAPHPNPTAYASNPHTQADPLGLSPYATDDLRIINTSSSVQHNRAAMDANGPNGFTGVYDPATGGLEARLSRGPNALVGQAGGHGQINREVFDASGESVGFVAIRREDFLEMRWNSISVNHVNFGNRAAPMEFRQPIMDTIGRMTGLPVVG